jgi:hypothetical protein
MIVVIPCWRRPAFLAACLTRIQCARGAKKQRYMFCVDHDADPRVHEVIKSFDLPYDLFDRSLYDERRFEGPRYNILEGYGNALSLIGMKPYAGELVALIEEDVLVSDDIFEFFEDAHALAGPDQPCVNACRNQNIGINVEKLVLKTGGATTIYPHKSYQSMAVCHRADFVDEFLCHTTDDAYYKDPISYCREHLFDAGLPSGAASQDGLIHRVIRGSHRYTIYPTEPRAFHAGWWGYNREEGTRLVDGGWREQAEWILQASNDQMNALADPRFRDIARCPLIRTRQTLKMV